MDLGRVEVIKGVASALYGAGAMGGSARLRSLPQHQLKPEMEGMTMKKMFRPRMISKMSILIVKNGVISSRINLDFLER